MPDWFSKAICIPNMVSNLDLLNWKFPIENILVSRVSFFYKYRNLLVLRDRYALYVAVKKCKKRKEIRTWEGKNVRVKLMKLTAFLSEIAQIKEIDLWPHFWVSYWLAVEIVALKKQAIAYNRACSFTMVNFANICSKIARVFFKTTYH